MSIIDNFLLTLPLPVIDHWGYLIIFVSAIAEALPVIGAFFPGQVAVLLGGFFAQLGLLRLEAVIFVAASGAIVGDFVGYITGRKYGHDFIVRYGKYIFFNQEKYEKTRKLVNEHAGKALIIGRFSPFIRALAPFIAGISQVKITRFIIYDIIGGIVWAAVSVMLGYIFGQGFASFSKYFGRFILAAIVIIILIVFGYRLLNKRRHIFSKYHLYYLTLNAFSIYAFSKMIEDYFDQESTYRFDFWLNQNISLIYQPWLNKLMIFISEFFRPEILFTVGILASVYFFIKNKWYRASLIFISLGGGLVLGMILKLLINRPRPLGGLVSETGLSFPSQHALMATIFFSLVLFIFIPKINNKWLKYIFAAGNVFLIIAIGFSRIYLRVHWFSDTLAGLALGLFWLTFLILVFRIGVKLFNHKKYGQHSIGKN
jgi:membrane-associated protein